MKRMRWNIAALVVGVLVVDWMTSVGTAGAATVLSNVALFQPVSAPSGLWDDLGSPPLSVMTDDVNGTRIITDDALSELWVDLGQEYTIEKVYLGQKTNGVVAGAKLYAFAADQVTPAGSTFTIPKNSNYNYMMSDWVGVRWIRLADEGGTPTVMTDSLRELRAFAQVETWTGSIGGTATSFIPGVGATATSTYPDAPDLTPASLSNSSGMSDQRGPVGDPTARSLPGGPFWHTATGVLEATVTFDLKNSYDMDRMLIWNLNQLTHAERCVKNATISYSVDGTNYTELADTNGAEPGNYTIPQILLENDQNECSLAIDLTGVTASYVQLTALDTYTTELDPANVVGLSEVRFYGELSTPPPAIPGDTNNDGYVDTTDANTLANNWGRTEADGGETIGDFNGDRAVNAADASILAANWTGPATEGTSVPEPLAATFLMSLFAVAAVGRPRGRTR